LPEALALTYTRAMVREIVSETPDTLTFAFELEDGRGAADFRPGQFNMLYVYGVGEVPISIASSRQERSVKHTIRSVGTVTTLISRLKVGDVVGLRGPFGVSWPLEDAYGKELMIVAGGLGLAPLRPVIMEALASAHRFKGVKVLYGARTPKDLLYKYEQAGWNNREGTELLVTVDRAEEGWSGNVGVVTTLFKQVEVLAEEAVAFVCGPEVMMKFTVQELLRRRVPQDNIVVSLERHMSCGVGTCGHCQMGPVFICKDGPVFAYPRVKRFFAREGV
jgi:NAD(P)H-flavin reductase